MHVNEKRIWKVITIISLGMIVSQVYFTQSRTTILAMIFILGFYFIILLKDSITVKKAGIILKPAGALLIAAVIAIISSNIINVVHTNYQEAQLVNISEPSNNSVSVESDQEGENVQAEPSEEDTEYRNLLPEKGADMNSFSSGRLFIWQTYAEGFNWIGNPADAEVPISPLIRQRTAHNSLVEITYRSGYITGAVYLLLVMITGIYILRVMFRNNSKNRNGDYFMAITSIGYIIFTSLMSSFNPLTAIIFLLYAIALPVMLEDRKTAKELT